VETWVWRVEGSRGKSLLYLHQSDMTWYGAKAEDHGEREKAVEGVAGLVVVVTPGRDEAATEAAIGSARLVFATRFGEFRRKIPLPAAMVVVGAVGKPKSAVDVNLARLAEASFTPVRYFGDRDGQGAEAVEWLLRRCDGAGVL
jgi:hypothetical protein